MTIIQMKHELKGIRAEIKAEIEKGLTMATAKDTTMEQIKAQSDKVDELEVRAALLQRGIDDAEGKAPEGKKAEGKNGGFRSLGEFAASVRNACTRGGAADSRLILNTAAGVMEINKDFYHAVRSMGAHTLDVITDVVIPGSLPGIITGFRLALGMGWMTVV